MSEKAFSCTAQSRFSRRKSCSYSLKIAATSHGVRWFASVIMALNFEVLRLNQEYSRSGAGQGAGKSRWFAWTVPHHQLEPLQVNTPFQHVRGKRVAKSVRADIFSIPTLRAASFTRLPRYFRNRVSRVFGTQTGKLWGGSDGNIPGANSGGNHERVTSLVLLPFPHTTRTR